jgi:hypothetical protein
MSHIKGVPRQDTPAYIADKQLFARGPHPRADLFLLAKFGPTQGYQDAALKRAIDSGWFVEADGKVGLSTRAYHYYAGTEPEPKAMGSMATPREVKPFRPMSPQYRVSSRGLRADAMDNSQANMPSHFAKVTP